MIFTLSCNLLHQYRFLTTKHTVESLCVPMLPCVHQQQQTECQSIVCTSAVACTAANQHLLHIQHNLPKLKQSLIKLFHLYPNQTLFTNISKQKLLS